MLQCTLAIIKPDAVAKRAIGDILSAIEKDGFDVIGVKMVHLNKTQAQAFCAVHLGRSFFDALTSFMSSGPIVVMALEKQNAIADLRQLIGATDPTEAEPGTIRRKWGDSRLRNAIHGSDGEVTAAFELNYFFARWEVPRIN